ncbi:MAG: sugar transferase [Verrucomicrobiota bacterium]
MISHSSHSPHTALFVPPGLSIPYWKRALDLLGCALALPFFAIAFVFVGGWIALVSRGSVFFRQERVGYMGRRFMLYKFRTMHEGSDVASHRSHFSALVSAKRPMQKLDATRDSRVIPGGWLLRASGLDELPQLLNVLRGEMSIVGPRPCIPYEYEQYSPWQRARFNTAPGLTGLWQVSGKNRTTFEEMIRFDIAYSKTKSLWLDLKIVALTLPALWTQIADTHVLRRDSANARVATTSHSHTAAPLQG